MSKDIKNTAIPAAGYVYQNRQGLKVLCDWLDAPVRYNRVKFECDDEEEAPKSLDDIVIERSDGIIDLQQIKFTPNPELNALSWDWLLEKPGKTARSRSMLKKWFDSFKGLDRKRIGEISLITNRRPDFEIEACLVAGRLSFYKIPENQRYKVVSQLGNLEDCESFFNALQIHHSDKSYIELEYEVDARLQPHGTPEGIAVLKTVALNWAIQKNTPYPDGWITLPEIHTILRASPPAPLPEDFFVPADYEVPDEMFHHDFLRDTSAAKEKVIVLTGPPGRGKSTYLSALCDSLSEMEIPVVRHHYFLSTTERGRDRLNSYMVEQSIQAQLDQICDDSPKTTGNLRARLEAHASHFRASGKPLVLILDGLDHVWRANTEDKRPLDDLFSQVIPCPDNLVLLVGTQSVDDVQLPCDLLAYAPKSVWRTLPAMSENAIFSYLQKAAKEGRITTGLVDKQESEEQLQSIASALRAKTNGHPLHVIYATAELQHFRHAISSWHVQSLKGDLSNDAKFYYASLWTKLPPSLKDTLRLICAFPFFWPKIAFSEIASRVNAPNPKVENVEHLLHSSTAGLKVFHESLAVFVRSTDGYGDRIEKLIPAVADWLEHSAPTSLRVNWLWTVQAKLGHPKNLITGLTRDWIMRRLEEGYPQSLFETLLSDALPIALQNAAFSDAYRLSHLKARMVEGSDFQMPDDEKARLIFYTLAVTTEESVIREAFASRHEADILHVAALGLALHFRNDRIGAATCANEALRRFRGLSRFSSRYRSMSGYEEFTFLASAFAQIGIIGATPESATQLVSDNDQAVWLPRVQVMVDEAKLDDLMMVASALEDGSKKDIISNACARTAAHLAVHITNRDDFRAVTRTPLVAVIETLITRLSKPLSAPIPSDWPKSDYSKRNDSLALLAHYWFFTAAHLGLCMAEQNQAYFECTRAPVYEGKENITNFLDHLSTIGLQVARRWWHGDFVDFHELYAQFETIEFRSFRQSYDMTSAAEDFRAALHRIACDIRLVSTLMKSIDDAPLPSATIIAASRCRWFDSASFRTQYAAGSLAKMADEAAIAFVRAQRSLLDAEVHVETSVHLQTPLELCAISVAHNLKEEARELCTQTWELSTGYAHRKDPMLSNTVDAIGYLVDDAADEARRLLSTIAPQIHHVLDYTDGKGTKHVLAEADCLLAKLSPSALVVKYEEHTYAGDWSLAENSLQAYIKQGIIDDWPLDTLMRTGLHAEVRDTLQHHVRTGWNSAAKPLHVLDAHSGWNIGLLKNRGYSESSIGSNPYRGDVTTFQPEQLEDLLESLSDSYTQQPELLRTWYEHWESKDRGKQVLDEVSKLLFSKNRWSRDVLAIADLAFQTKRKMSGLPAAWKYLVQAQIRSGGWIGHLETEESTQSRLDLVAEVYPMRCDDFVIDTTYGPFDELTSSRIAPSEAIVYFYIRQGRIAEAVEFTETMINCVVEDTRTLPLKQPRWMTELVSSQTSEDR
jgi:hypothetical protein